jgi:hypothetical protein
VPTYSISTVTATLVASTAYTAVEIKPPAGVGIVVKKWWVDVTGASGDKPLLVQMGPFSAAVNTLTAISAANVPKVDYGQNGLNAQSAVGLNATVEGAGTFSSGYEQRTILPLSSQIFWDVVAGPADNTAWWFPPSTTSVRLRITPGGSITTATATCGMTWYEG